MSKNINWKDIKYYLILNASKRWILRIGPDRKSPISVCNTPAMQRHVYLSVQIGRNAKPQQAAATNLCSKANLVIAQNSDLSNCCNYVKNMTIRSYGFVFHVRSFTKTSCHTSLHHKGCTSRMATVCRLTRTNYI